MNEFLPKSVRNRSLAYLSGAAVASLFAGSAQAAVQTVAVNVALTGDNDGHVFALRMTNAGAITHTVLPSFGAFASLAALVATDALFGIVARYRAWMPDYTASAYGFGGSVVRTSDFASHMTASNSVGSMNWFGSSMQIANQAEASVWATGGYVGFTLTPEGSGNTYYGWVHIASMAGNASSLTIDGYAWETTPGGAIHVMSSSGSGTGGGSPTGGTPEPATVSLALLALGAAGVMRHKRRRRNSPA